MERMSEDKTSGMTRKISVYGKKIGRPKKRWIELIADDCRRRKLVGLDPRTGGAALFMLMIWPFGPPPPPGPHCGGSHTRSSVLIGTLV